MNEFLCIIQQQLTTHVGGVLVTLLQCIGVAGIFHKCGIKPVWSFIPFVHVYQLGRAAGVEDEGRVAMVSEIAAMAALTVYTIGAYDMTTRSGLVCGVVALMAGCVFIIYTIRIYLALCRMFGRRRLWTVLFCIPGVNAIAFLIYGFHPAFLPKHRVDEDNGAAPLVGGEAPVLDRGLTINIKDRSVIDSFKRKYLLRDIHLNIEPGEMVLLLGGSGAGKTTFVNAVTGYEKAHARIELNHQSVYHSFRKMKYKIGFVPQADLMRTADTVEATLRDAAVMRMPKNCGHEAREKRIDEVLDLFGLTPVRHSLVEKLSGGQRKRLSIAIEYISDPQLFILDEPDSGLDGVIAKDLMAHLHSISREGGRIVMVITHTPDRVIEEFDKVIVLAKDANRTGRLAFYGSVDEARSFFGKDTMEEILLSINQKVEGGEGRADEFIRKYNEQVAGHSDDPTPKAPAETATA